MLFPITLQLLRCLPFERAVWCPHTVPSAGILQTKIPMLPSASAPSDCKTSLSCVSDVGRLLSCQWICLGDEIGFEYVLAIDDYMLFSRFVNSYQKSKP